MMEAVVVLTLQRALPRSLRRSERWDVQSPERNMLFIIINIMRHGPAQWRAPHQRGPASQRESETVTVLLWGKELPLNKTCFWYQFTNSHPSHRHSSRKPVSLCYIFSDFVFIFPLCQFSHYSVDYGGCLMSTSDTVKLINKSAWHTSCWEKSVTLPEQPRRADDWPTNEGPETVKLSQLSFSLKPWKQQEGEEKCLQRFLCFPQ